MEELMACRVCLATDNVKLYSFLKIELSQAFVILTGEQITAGDGLPQHVCSYCSTLLLKYVTFREKCCNAQEFLKYCLQEQGELSMNYIRSLNREIHELILPYKQNKTNPTISYVHEDANIKEEREDLEVFNDDFEDGNFDVKQTIDKPKRRKRKRKDKDKKTQFDIVTIKCEDIPHHLTDPFLESLHVDNINNIDKNIDHTDSNIDTVNNIDPTDNILHTVSNIDHTDNNDEIDSDTQDSNEFHLKDVEIVHLTKEEQLEEIEARKTSFNYLNSAYKCDKCYKGFITDATYRNHMQRHDPKNGAYECDICFSRWPESRFLRAHVINTHKRKYMCKLCHHVARSSHRAKEHCKWHNGFTFKCKICGASFAKSTSHLTHIRLQHPSNFCCELCGESFIGDFGLRMHKKRAHRNHEDSGPVLSSCKQCGVEFQSSKALLRHHECSTNGLCDPEIRSCRQCGEGFQSDEQLTEHLKVHQGLEKERVYCDDCKSSFTSEKSYTIHYQRVHLGVKLKQNKPSLKRPADSVVCEICGKKCITKATLRYHQRIHTGERPFHCTECPKKFSIFQRLQIHVRTHTGETPYKCKHCPKAFKHKAALNRHDRVHTGAKPYICSHCGKAFSQSNSMKLHVNTVHLKLPAPYRNRRNKN
ncbi:uncharacterized protein [Epargyreus clarus]|uniref:uncharacterized protein n=1 Tax=Epargyreus clarus TaxID=520877 RepID=UPI003C2BEB16